MILQSPFSCAVPAPSNIGSPNAIASTQCPKGHVYRAEIHHLPWPLQDARAHIEINTMASVSGISLPATTPLMHFAKKLDVLVWPLYRAR
jgi:hypothetical protein